MKNYLSSERYYILTLLLWLFAGYLPILPVIKLFIGDMTDLDVEVLLIVMLISTGLVFLGLRNRMVVLSGGDILIQWGRRLPLVLKHYPAAELQNFQITREPHFFLSPIASGSYRVSSLPDRFRLTAIWAGRKVNLGSYMDEAAARNAVKHIHP